MLALRYATRYPGVVTAVIFENPSWDIALSARAALPRVADMLAALGHDGQSRAARAATGQDGPPPEILAAYVTALDALGDASEQYFAPDPDTRNLLRHIRSARADGAMDGDDPSDSTARHYQAITADETFYQSLLPLLADLQMHAFLITGGHDPTTSPEQRDAFGRSSAPHVMREFEHAGHFMHADEPE